MRLLTASLLLLTPALLAAQAAPHPVDAMMDQLKADNAWTLSQQKSLCEIPAPPFKEAVRAEEYRKRFVALGLQRVRVDAVGNVLGERPGTGRGPPIVLSGHLDTVFPDSTDVRVKESSGRMTAPASPTTAAASRWCWRWRGRTSARTPGTTRVSSSSGTSARKAPETCAACATCSSAS